MVLHNSKWDKKATRQYNKKHGLTAPRKDPKDNTDHWKAKKKEGNLWRYQEPEDSDEEEKREVNELLDHENVDEGQGEEGREEGENQHTLRQAAIKPVGDRDDELPDDYYLPPDEYQDDAEQQAIIRKHRAKAELEDATPRQKMMTMDDPEGFDRLQEENGRMQFHNDIKRRFGGKPKSRRDNHVPPEFGDKKEEDDIDDFLNEIDQLNVKDDNDDDLDWLHGRSAESNQDTNPSSDFLDSLLKKR